MNKLFGNIRVWFICKYRMLLTSKMLNTIAFSSFIPSCRVGRGFSGRDRFTRGSINPAEIKSRENPSDKALLTTRETRWWRIIHCGRSNKILQERLTLFCLVSVRTEGRACPFQHREQGSQGSDVKSVGFMLYSSRVTVVIDATGRKRHHGYVSKAVNASKKEMKEIVKLSREIKFDMSRLNWGY